MSRDPGGAYLTAIGADARQSKRGITIECIHRPSKRSPRVIAASQVKMLVKHVWLVVTLYCHGSLARVKVRNVDLAIAITGKSPMTGCQSTLGTVANVFETSLLAH